MQDGQIIKSEPVDPVPAVFAVLAIFPVEGFLPSRPLDAWEAIPSGQSHRALGAFRPALACGACWAGFALLTPLAALPCRPCGPCLADRSWFACWTCGAGIAFLATFADGALRPGQAIHSRETSGAFWPSFPHRPCGPIESLFTSRPDRPYRAFASRRAVEPFLALRPYRPLGAWHRSACLKRRHALQDVA